MVLLQSKQHSSIVGQNLGWHLLPIKTREKNPGLLLGKAWQHQASNHIGQILFWEQEYPKCNWGLLLGPASGVIDVEDDSPEGRELLDAAMTECGVQTPCYTSGKGVHRLFLHDERMVQDSAAIVKAFGTEWRFGDDAHQSVVPPSIHPSGKAYQWLPGLSPEEVTVARLPDTMWQLMLTLRAKWAEKLDQERQAKRQQTKITRRPTSYQTPTGNFTQHVDAAETMIDVLPWDSLLTSEGYCRHDNEDWTRPGSDWSNARSATVLSDTDRLHVWTDAGPISSGHYSKWRFWYQSHGFTDHEQIDAAKTYLGPQASQTIDTAYSETKQPQPPQESQGPPPTVIKSFAGKPAEELYDLATQPIEWLVDDVFSCDQATVVGAKQKSLKTTLMCDLAVALVSGTLWLNRFIVPKKLRVLFVTGEASERAAIRKIKRAADSRNLRREDLSGLRIEAVNFPNLPSAADCVAIERAVREHNIEVVILDPLYMGLQGLNTANLTEVGPALRQFMESCRPAKIIIVHHCKKTASYDDAPNLEDLSQAGIAEFAGNYWLMGRMAEYTGDGQHEIAIRYGGRDEQFGLLKLDFDERKWTSDFSSLMDHRQDISVRKETEKVNAMTAKLLKELKRYPEGLSESGLATAIGTKKQRGPYQTALQELEERKAIVCLLDFKSGNRATCRGWKLATAIPVADNKSVPQNSPAQTDLNLVETFPQGNGDARDKAAKKPRKTRAKAS